MSLAKRTPLSGQDKTRWREKVREECMQRVKQHRQSVLWRMRQVSRPPQLLLIVSSDGRGSALGCTQRIRQHRRSALWWVQNRIVMLSAILHLTYGCSCWSTPVVQPCLALLAWLCLM